MACIAIVNIPEGTFSTPFRAGEILTNPLGESRGNARINFPLQIGVTASGELQPVSPIPVVFWPKLIDLASDCHDQNIKLCRWKTKDTLILQTTRDIHIGQKLQMWFSEDLMMSELGIPPYLSPFNIKGKTKEFI
ncbi:hypothetical protein Ocin01_06631 [Orchesella cincta]|uniref:SET domain-containing protein n=1 Tax=Orchesella cincta TaxID=48709 RepID=A0A1D2N492_ORCCI|nr:hypothetical protein Ocin01_06631 [Orchesella cincta]